MNRTTALTCALAAFAIAGCFGRTDLVPSYGKTLAVEADVAEVDRPAPVDSPPPALTLGPGDALDIQVAGIPDTRERCLVGADGRLYYGPLDGIRAAGRTLDDIASDLVPAMAVYYRDPKPAVVPAELVSRHATVLGRVAKPGPVALHGGERIIDLIASAGGFARGKSTSETEEIADLTGALYARGNQVLAIDFIGLSEGRRPEHNLLVHPDDYLYVPSGQSREINVLGAVQSPQAVPYRNNLTITRAIADAGGYTRDAYLDRVVVVRGSTGSPRAGMVDVRAIAEGRRPDVFLRPKDIVYVPGRTSENPRLLLDTANRAYVTSIASSYANDVYNRLLEKPVGNGLDSVLP
jgi:polysaccharide export outer membrane protein